MDSMHNEWSEELYRLSPEDLDENVSITFEGEEKRCRIYLTRTLIDYVGDYGNEPEFLQGKLETAYKDAQKIV